MRGVHEDTAILVGVVWWCGFVLFASIAYVTVGIVFFTSLLVFITSGVLAITISGRFSVRNKPDVPSKGIFGTSPFLFLAACIDVLLLSIFFLVRTDEALRTPWMFPVSIGAFVLYGLSTMSLLIGRLAHRAVFLPALLLHCFTTFGVSLIAFKYGFGYDPLIHQAAERYVFEHGRILPLEPYYIGQYAIVTAISFLTSIPTDLVDRALVPLLASVSVPLIGLVGLVRGYGFSHQHARIVLLLLFLFPLSAFTFTVPHNLTVLYLVWWLFFLPKVGTSGLETIACVSIVTASLATHPLLGVPLELGTVFFWLTNRNRKIIGIIREWGFLLSGTLALATTLVGMFVFVRVKAGLPPLEFDHITNGAAYFLRFFEAPSFPVTTPFQLISLYWYEYALKFIIPGCAFIFLILQKGNPVGRVFAALGSGILLAMFILVSFTSLPGVAPAEQYEFVLRLREAVSMILWFAAIIAAGRWYFSKKLPSIAHLIALSSIGMASAASLYLAYPQMNDVREQAGENVSGSDIAAVKLLEYKYAVSNGYVVLAPSLLSAVGLREVGFNRTFQTPSGQKAHIYPIGPTEALFPYAQEMLYRGLSKENLEQLSALAGNRVITAAVPAHWWRREGVIYDMDEIGAKKITGSSGVLLYEFPHNATLQ